MSRTLVQLGDVAEFINGVAFKPEDWSNTGERIIRIQNLTDPSKPFNRTTRVVESQYHVQPGDLLVSWSASLGVFRWNEPDVGLVNQHIFRVVPKDNVVDHRYLAYALQLAIDDMQRHLHGATMQHVNRGEFLATKIFLPPLPEQRRIAAILDKADALRMKRRETVAALIRSNMALFNQLFGDPIANEKRWPSAVISDFVAEFLSGKNVVAADDDEGSSKCRVLKVSAVTSLEFRPEEAKAVPSDYDPPRAHFVHEGDLLFSRANTSELVGATAYVFKTPPNLVLPDKIWKFIWHSERRAEPLFVWFMFRHPSVRREITKRSTGTSGSMKNISQEKALGIRVGLPPLLLQRKFAAAVVKVERLGSAQQASLAMLDDLFTSFQHRAFRGEL